MKNVKRIALCWLLVLVLLASNVPLGQAVESSLAQRTQRAWIASTAAAQAKVMSKVSEIVKSCVKSGMSDYEKALTLHDYLVDNASYDETYSNYHAEGVLLQGSGVCQSYAVAYSLLLDKAGIRNDFDWGTDHIWNLVQMDGEWYHVDATWDDPTGGYTFPVTSSIAHEFFGLPDEAIHTIRSHEGRNRPYQATAYKNNYFYKNGLLDKVLKSVSAEIQGKLNRGVESGTAYFSEADVTPTERFDEIPGRYFYVNRYQIIERTAAMVLRDRVFKYNGGYVLLNVTFNGKLGMDYAVRKDVPAPSVTGMTTTYAKRAVGQPNRWRLTAKGGVGTYEYYFRLYQDGVPYMCSGWISEDSYRVDFTEPGEYIMHAKVRDQNGTESSVIVDGATTVVQLPRVQAMTAKYAVREAGGRNRWYAEAADGKAPYKYYFRLYKDGEVCQNSGWISDDNYGAELKEPGTYVMYVKVQDAAGEKSEFTPGGTTVVVEPVPPTVTVTATYDVRETGQPNRYYAAVEGGMGPYTYYFRLYRNGEVYLNSGWIDQDNYRVDFTEPGTYVMTVKAQSKAGLKSEFTPGGTTVVAEPVPPTVTVTATYAAREPGQPNRYYAAVKGGAAPYTYYFRLYKDGVVYRNSGWITANNYRIDFTEPGVYVMQVKAQSQTGRKSDWVSCAQTVVKVPEPLTATVASKYAARETGQPNRYYATAQGGTAPYTYYFRLYKDGVVYRNSGWISADNYRVDFTEAGTYTMTVKVQDAKGNKTDWVNAGVTVVAEAVPPTVTVTGKYAERTTGQPNRYYAAAQGGTAPYTYYFRLYRNGEVCQNSGWISANNYRVDYTEAGTYVMTVKVQDQNGQKSEFTPGGVTVVKLPAE